MADIDETAGRRGFLKLATLGAAASGVAAATGGRAEAAAEDAPREGYRETAHVKAYLDSCRF